MHALAIDEQQVVGARLPRQIDVFSQLYITFRPEDDEPAVAPGRQAVRSKPVDPDIAGGILSAQQHLAEILKLRRVGIGAVGNRGREVELPLKLSDTEAE